MNSSAKLRDIKFALSCLSLDGLLASPRFKDFSRDDFDIMIEEANKVATGVLAPLNSVSDACGARFHKSTGKVTTPKGYREAFVTYAEGGWGSGSMPQEFGGMGLPESVAMACGELFIGACSAFAMVHGLTRSATDVIIAFGSEAQRARYVPHMVGGKWTGTMCLTEPHAGSDVGAITTMATPIPGREGFYSIRGSKCFISFGDHDLAENIVHLVLARTPGSPKGTHGISLFIVPKIKVGASGALSVKKNDVVCGGIEHKMGINGSPTCTLFFGEHDHCEGELLGDVNAGMKYMFLMMNEARLLVGLQGEALASASYESALAYAKERLQGSDIREMKDPNAKKVPIIAHPDVRRMLMTMRAHTEGMRAFIYQVAHYIDMSRCAETSDDRAKYHGWVELLTPVVKAYCSDTGFHVAELGMLVAGGAGYCRDLPLEQYVRDAMITRIYEGTNGIQALDLIARKIPMGGGSILGSLADDMLGELETMKGHATLGGSALAIENALTDFAEILVGLMDKRAWKTALLQACSVLETFGTIACAFYLLKQAHVASEKQGECGSAHPDVRFYEGKIRTATFFTENLLPRVYWRIRAIKNGDESCLADIF